MDISQWKQRIPKIPYSEYDTLHEKLAKINGIEDIDAFLDPDETAIHSPYLLKNMDSLVERIIRAIKNNLKIFVFGDCDADGLISGIILYKYLLNFSENVELEYVERSTGHGTQHIINEIPEDTDLYIAVDSSSNDVEEMKLLSSKGIECLVIDHHTVTTDNPYAVLVNPQQEGCRYPNKNACGGLLVYKVCQVLDDYMNTNYAEDFSDLPGFALMADMMSMREMENRYYARHSLVNLKHFGLKALFEAMNKDINNLTSTDFVYGVSPAITAATRLDNIKLAIDLLMSNQESPTTSSLVKQLVEANEYRKKIQAEALEVWKPIVNNRDKAVMIFDPTLGRGMNGLVAQELSKTFNKPAIVLGQGDNEDVWAGSFRGLDGFSMLELLQKCENVLYAAGHDSAGGIQLLMQNFELLKRELNKQLWEFEPDDTLYYDLEFDIDDVNEKLINSITNFYRVSGREFESGNFRIKGLFVEDKKLMSKMKNTVKIICDKIHLMKFKTDEDFYNNVPVFSEIEAIGTLNVNEWKVYKPRFKIVKTNQLFIEDYKVVI
ncbi:DHH family phosphoesterase [Paenibacillus lactis]|uniref:DHH family phosphoesterase n=1 Tax=Paenibacillus lactis TaxID=228574 RepID=UPI003D74AC6A